MTNIVAEQVISLTAWPAGRKYWAYILVDGEVEEVEITEQQYRRLLIGLEAECNGQHTTN